MKAIITEAKSATPHKPRRIVAFDHDGNRWEGSIDLLERTAPEPELGDAQLHAEAARQLALSLNWWGVLRHGAIGPGKFVFVWEGKNRHFVARPAIITEAEDADFVLCCPYTEECEGGRIVHATDVCMEDRENRVDTEAKVVEFNNDTGCTWEDSGDAPVEVCSECRRPVLMPEGYSIDFV